MSLVCKCKCGIAVEDEIRRGRLTLSSSIEKRYATAPDGMSAISMWRRKDKGGTRLLGRKSSQNEFPEYLKCFSININQNEPIHASFKKILPLP